MEFKDSKTKAKNREKLVQSAYQLYMDKGIGLTSIKEIMENADMDRKTFYTFFESKEQVAEYLFIRTMSNLKKFKIREVDSRNGFDKMSFLMNQYVDHLLTHKDEINYTMHYDYYFRKDANINYMIELFNADDSNTMFDMFRVVKDGIEDGSVDLGQNYKMELTMLLHGVLGFVQRMVFRESILNQEIQGMIGSQYTDEDIKQHVNKLMNGIKK